IDDSPKPGRDSTWVRSIGMFWDDSGGRGFTNVRPIVSVTVCCEAPYISLLPLTSMNSVASRKVPETTELAPGNKYIPPSGRYKMSLLVVPSDWSSPFSKRILEPFTARYEPFILLKQPGDSEQL